MPLLALLPQAREAEATHLAQKAVVAGLQRTVANLQVRVEEEGEGEGPSAGECVRLLAPSPPLLPGAHRRGGRGHLRRSPCREARCRRVGGPRQAAPGEAPQTGRVLQVRRLRLAGCSR